MISYYLAVGVGVYLSASASHFNSFKNASTVSIIKGILLGLVFWPIGITILYLENNTDKKD